MRDASLLRPAAVATLDLDEALCGVFTFPQESDNRKPSHVLVYNIGSVKHSTSFSTPKYSRQKRKLVAYVVASFHFERHVWWSLRYFRCSATKIDQKLQ